MTLQNKKQQWIWFIGLAVLVGDAYWGVQSASSTPPQTNIRLSGSKPNDAAVKVWANYWVHGDDCEAYSYDMFGRKAHQGGKITTFFTPNEVDSDERYEFDVPYSSYTNSKNCTVELRDIKVEAYNAFDTVGFAQLRIYQSGTNYDNKALDLSSQIESRSCEPFYSPKYNRWTNGFGCDYYVNDEKISKEQEFNAETVYFDFSQFNSETVIHYDILAGEDYRSTPLDSETGK